MEETFTGKGCTSQWLWNCNSQWIPNKIPTKSNSCWLFSYTQSTLTV